MKNKSTGRVRRSEAEWRELITRFEKSGESSREFCKKAGISAESLRRWRIKLGSETEQHAFVPVTTASSSSPSWTLEINLPGDCHIRLQG
jgi:transposase-like protein